MIGRVSRAVDKAFEAVAPTLAVKRAAARAKLQQIDMLTGGGGYGQHGASGRKTSLLSWLTGWGGDPDEDITRNLQTLRARSRDLYMGGGLGCGAIKTMCTNAVGPGLTLNPQIDAVFLGMTEESASRWEQEVEREFYLWAESQNCDALRTSNFAGLQKLAFLSFLMNGDVFALLPMKSRSEWPYELCVQLIEGDRVCNPLVGEVSRDVMEGVELDREGAPVAYWICEGHPGAVPTTAEKVRQQYQWKRCPAFGENTGRRNVVHLMDPERIGVRRGVPFLAPVIEDLKQMDRYTKAELLAAIIGGMMTVFVTSDLPEVAPYGEQIAGIVEGEQDIALGPGAVITMDPGQKISVPDFKHPNVAFDGFVSAISRQIGVALGLPHEVLIKSFTASYSASRGALLEAWKTFKTWRSFFVSGFCQPVYESWLDEAVAKGRIHAPGYFDDPMIRKAYCGSEWHGPAQGSLNPLQEAGAYKTLVEECFTTRSAIVAEMNGGDYGRVVRQRIAEEKLRRDGDLKEVRP